ncbi:MAG TPA: exodeoxyribonuclease I [Verrucomicrobiae bacterium]|nr:exodeoxyribonuclease I [Verrucomicrobiae bacterium]
MAKSFFFYDLETSGLDARADRIMQFAGQRTTPELEQIGEPINVLVKLTDEILPSPHATLVTGITPQKTHEEGISELEFIRLLCEEVFTPETVTVGFNNIRFDDEFVRHALWRNFYDPYEWCWKDVRGRWDLLDVVRMTRALRPEGINWPVDENGNGTNRLELLTKANELEHLQAHDAMSDVHALIAVTKLIKTKQPKLYDYLLGMREKKSVMNLVNPQRPVPFVYSSGRYESIYHKTTVAYPIADSARPGGALVYDLRYDPTLFASLPVEELKKRLYATREERQKPDFIPLPVKELVYNRCPAVAPLGVLEQGDAWQRIGLTPEIIQKHLGLLEQNPQLVEKLKAVFANRQPFAKVNDVEHRLYDGFTPDGDKRKIEIIRNASPRELATLTADFDDERLHELLVRYKARHYPHILSEEERTRWEQYRSQRIQAQLPGFMKNLQLLAQESDEEKQFLLQELHLWAESIVSVDQ